MNDKKPWSKGMKITLGVLGTLLVFMFVLIATSTPDSAKPVPLEDQQKVIADYYTQLIGYESVIARAYNGAIQKAGKGDVQGAYLDFKGDAGLKISGARQSLYELSIKVPNVSDKKLLEDAASALATSAYKREQAMKLFEEGVENNANGKILEATATSKKADDYLNQASALLEQISSKYSLAK